MAMPKFIWIITLILTLILVSLLIYFFQPLFLRRSFIGRSIGLDIPRTTQIVEYRIAVNEFGIDPFFAKLQLSQEDYEILIQQFSTSMVQMHGFNLLQRNFNYESEIIDNIQEVGWKYRMTSRTSIHLLGSSRFIESFIIKTIDGEYFLYVFY